MKILFINACVREKSRTLRLCKEYIENAYTGENEIKEIFLPGAGFEPHSRERLLRRDRDIAKRDFASPEYTPAKDFAQADEILIGAPYWDCSFPSLLKIYLENICVSGITFGFSEDGKPLRLCHAERIVYITTSGGYIPEVNSVRLYLNEMCAMLGIPGVKIYSAQGLDITGNDPEEILHRASEELPHSKFR